MRHARPSPCELAATKTDLPCPRSNDLRKLSNMSNVDGMIDAEPGRCVFRMRARLNGATYRYRRKMKRAFTRSSRRGVLGSCVGDPTSPRRVTWAYPGVPIGHHHVSRVRSDRIPHVVDADGKRRIAYILSVIRVMWWRRDGFEFSDVIRRARVFVYIPWINKVSRACSVFRPSGHLWKILMACQYRDGRGPLYRFTNINGD